MKALNPSAAAVILSAFIMGLGGIASAQKDKSPAIPVDENKRVESMSDIYFGQVVDAVGTNVIQHNRATADIKTQGIIRENRDTLYSKVVIDARGGFTLTLPAADKTYMAALILNYNTGLVREAKDQGDVGTYMAHSDRPRVIEITHEAAGADFGYQEDSVVKEGGEKAADVRRHYAAFGWGGQLERYATYLTTR